MLSPRHTTQFKRDLKLAIKRGQDPEELKKVVKLLLEQVKLPFEYREHNLSGNYKHRRECHIRPDWLLIYKVTDTEIIFERTGSHSDLFR
jgi:mRNA interferase YafQ